MDIYALIGPSGTGKSHHAMEVAAEYQITHLIDDGLLIKAGKKIAGRSAKAEATMIAAVKRAIFLDPQQALEMKGALAKEKPKKLLILGTSEHMIERIVEALDLGVIGEKIFIHEVCTPEEIAQAQAMRKEGKHIIPMPAVEVKKDLPNYWIDPLMDLFKKKGRKSVFNEKSVVRPTFSQLGRVTISDHVVCQMAEHIAKNYPALDQHGKYQVKISDLGVTILCGMKVAYGTLIQQTIRAYQAELVHVIEELTSLSVLRIDVKVTGIRIQDGRKDKS